MRSRIGNPTAIGLRADSSIIAILDGEIGKDNRADRKGFSIRDERRDDDDLASGSGRGSSRLKHTPGARDCAPRSCRSLLLLPFLPAPLPLPPPPSPIPPPLSRAKGTRRSAARSASRLYYSARVTLAFIRAAVSNVEASRS